MKELFLSCGKQQTLKKVGEISGRKGLVVLYTGNGKGKTTAALGLALRGAGHGEKVLLLHFLKSLEGTGEFAAISACLPQMTMVSLGAPHFVFRGQVAEEDRQKARYGLEYAGKALESAQYDLVVLDEICVAVDLGLIAVDEVLRLLDKRSPETDLVLTGRNAPRELVDRADLVTEMKEVKHPYTRGIPARKGMEF